MDRELKILLFSYAMIAFAGGMFGPIYAIFVENIGGDILTAGGAYAAFSIAAGVLTLLISRWEDHVKHQEKLIILGFAINSIGFLGYLFIQTPMHLFIVQIILGISMAIISPAYDSLYSKHLDKGKFSSEWGMWEGMNYIVLGISAAIGGVFGAIFGFRILFIAMFLISLVGLAISSNLVLKRKK